MDRLRCRRSESARRLFPPVALPGERIDRQMHASGQWRAVQLQPVQVETLGPDIQQPRNLASDEPAIDAGLQVFVDGEQRDGVAVAARLRVVQIVGERAIFEAVVGEEYAEFFQQIRAGLHAHGEALFHRFTADL